MNAFLCYYKNILNPTICTKTEIFSSDVCKQYFLNGLEMSLDIILYATLHSDNMGLKSKKHEGLDFLGIRERKVALITPKI